MDKKEMVIDILKTTGCLTAKEVSGFIVRKFNEKVSPQSVSGSLRPLVQQGLVGSYKNASGHTVYWINKEAWNAIT